MNLILLPGNNPKHKEWLEQVDARLAPLFEHTVRQEYRHWKTGEPELDVAHELSQLIDLAFDLEPYAFFAKSAGTLLCLQGIEQGILQPTACVFAGIPLPMVEKYGFPLERWLQAVTMPIRILQNTNDPYGSYQTIANIIAAANNPHISIKETAGDTHDYLNFETIYQTVQSLDT